MLALLSRSFSALLAAVAVLSRRMGDGTLLPGGCRGAERDFYALVVACVHRSTGRPAPPAAALLASSAFVGAEAAMVAAERALAMLHVRRWPARERRPLERFALAVMDAIPATAGLGGYSPGGELHLVAFVEQNMVDASSASVGYLDDGFREELLAKWASPAVAGALRDRGSLRDGVMVGELAGAELDVPVQADVAARGFRRCGLWSPACGLQPACGRLETTVRHFRLCGGCDSVAYCCDAHHGLHWDEGHRRECGALRRAGAKPPSTADA